MVLFPTLPVFSDIHAMFRGWVIGQLETTQAAKYLFNGHEYHRTLKQSNVRKCHLPHSTACTVRQEAQQKPAGKEPRCCVFQMMRPMLYSGRRGDAVVLTRECTVKSTLLNSVRMPDYHNGRYALKNVRRCSKCISRKLMLLLEVVNSGAWMRATHGIEVEALDDSR